MIAAARKPATQTVELGLTPAAADRTDQQRQGMRDEIVEGKGVEV